MISLDKFKESDIRLGTIVSAEKVEGADKLLKLMFDFGGPEPVQILSGIAEFYDPAVLVGKQVPVIVNLEPRTLKGQASNGMMLAVVVDGKPVLLHPEKEVSPGSIVR
ncbi:MAG: hypothetical protein A2908_01555 [Candidatus Staskawiczbacteria bacterium RIFCSPLOWO2_01_FULL_38_12b]|uniref:tRNA-binding domain-containing protein n=1 Tax=Candidatus Staskawiczbacteria bacterium RIFCSPLOWO2_01_FULL_38_12b TaxID=1802214 RepID=A0A1G2ICR6_9BACT|nr:MAG: hypothetical protein A2908_01555 [Candidatus Staskawiczbacteria bacterium RIFCSPLOWO2_01_FULL_38_12b]